MDKKSVIGLVLIFAIFVGYMWWIKPSDEEIAARRAQDSLRWVEAVRQDSIAQAAADSVRAQDSLYQLAMNDPSLVDSINAVINALRESNMGVFGINKVNPNVTVSVSNGLIRTDIQSLGAQVQSVVLDQYVTFDSMPLQLITPGSDNMDLVFVDANNSVVNTQYIPFMLYADGRQLTEDSQLQVPEGDSLVLSFRAPVSTVQASADGDTAAPVQAVAADRYLEFRYVFYDQSYEVDFDVEFHGLTGFVNAVPNLTLQWNNRMNRQEQVDKSQKGRSNRNKDIERFYTTINYKNVGDKARGLKDGRDDAKQITTPIEWVAYKQQFFCAILMSETGFRNAQQLSVFSNPDDKDDNYLCSMNSTLGADYDATQPDYKLDMRFYYGPNGYRELRNLDRGMERMLPLGWGFFLTQWTTRFFIIPIFNFLARFGWNYGIIIIVLTLIFKLVLLPLTYPSYKTSAVMRHLKPEMDAINKRYPDQDQMMQKQQAMSALQKKAGINPVAGCLPALIQLPILWAMFRFFPASIELRQQPFLWCDDLSTYDSILNLNFNIPGYGDHVSLFCLLMFAVQLFYTWWTMRQQQSQAQMPGMKFMMYFMPFMMLFFLNSQSAALNIYYCINLLFTILLMWGIRIFMTEERVRKTMARNSEKMAKNPPKKKSNFQRRLEEMQKMSEQMQKQQQQQKRR